VPYVGMGPLLGSRGWSDAGDGQAGMGRSQMFEVALAGITDDLVRGTGS
jgi:hypothetical protein